MGEKGETSVVEAYMIREVGVVMLSDSIGFLGLLVLRICLGEAGQGFRETRERFMIGELGVGEESCSGGFCKVGSTNPHSCGGDCRPALETIIAAAAAARLMMMMSSSSIS